MSNRFEKRTRKFVLVFHTCIYFFNSSDYLIISLKNNINFARNITQVDIIGIGLSFFTQLIELIFESLNKYQIITDLHFISHR